MGKTAIVIGTTGLVGSELLQKLLSCEHYNHIITFSRRPLPITHSKLTNHVIEFEKLTQYSALFVGDVLFSCLGTTRKQAGSIEAQRIVDFDYQFIAAQLAISNGVAHYCLVSSSGANANSHSPYLKMKGQLEQHIKQLTFDKISILQPSLLVGKRDKFRLAEWLGSLVLPMLTRLPSLSRYRPIPAELVAKKLLNVSLTQQQHLSYYVLDDLFH